MTSFAQYFNFIPQFVLTWVTFFSAGALFFIYRLYIRKSHLNFYELFNHCIPFNPLKSKSFHVDVKVFLIRKLTDSFFIIPEMIAITFVSSIILSYLTYQYDEHFIQKMSYISTLICTIVTIISIEFAYYVNHYMNHKLPFLWELHKVHHSADVLNPLTDRRAHTASLFLKSFVVGIITGIPAGFFIFYYGISVPEVIIINAVSLKILKFCTLDPLKHSHIPLGFGALEWIFISPHMHQVHHSDAKIHWSKNIGINLSIFDWIFGTGYRPFKGEKLTFGLYESSGVDHERFETLWDVYIEPLKRSFHQLLKPKKSDLLSGRR